MSALPVWVLYVQALGLPIFAGVIAVVGAWIGWQQMQIARAKLQHDLYERRFKIYDATMNLLRSAGNDSIPSVDALRDFVIEAPNAVFLFDDAVQQYLNGFLNRMHAVRTNRVMLDSGTELTERARLGQKFIEDSEWVRNEFTIARDKFGPFLGLPRVRTFPWQ